MEIKRAFDFLLYQNVNYPLSNAISFKRDGKWKKYSTAQVVKISNQVSIGLMKMGIKKGDNIALVSESRPEWNFIDLAVQQIGAVLVPMYPNLSVADYRYIIDEAEIKLAFVSNTEHLNKIAEAATSVDSDRIYSFDKIKACHHWTEIGIAGGKQDPAPLEKIRNSISEEDLLTIIYTSGTTGNPKGVMLSHKNVVSNAIAASKVSDITPGKARALSFLPLNHIYERTGVYMYLYLGVSIFYAESIETVGDNIKEVKPHTFNTVPRLLEKVYDKIIAKGEELSTVKKGIFFWALNLALKYDPDKNAGAIYKRQLAIADKLIFSKWREALGGHVLHIQSGAAALQPRLARVFWAAGIKVLEGYGLTETSPVVTATQLEGVKIGHVGKTVEGVSIKLGKGNEILCKGPNLMMGYYKNPDLTAEVIKDGWFHTGDIGEINDGFLKITDRKKELFKTSGGLYIAPQIIENKLKESALIDQAMVVGEGKKYPAALITPNFDKLNEIASNNFILYSDYEELVENEQVLKELQKDIDQLNKQLGQWERIKQFRVLPDTWSPETGELTPTLKLKRRIIKDKYDSTIAEIYKDDGSDLFKGVEEMSLQDMDPELLKELQD
jgi:long-chain acyl-CoA synthetase